MKLRSSEIAEIWETQIRPELFGLSKPSIQPVTVFLGGQPGAGKTNAGLLADRFYPDLVHIIGDDYRKYHPQYDDIVLAAPVRMPSVTGHAAGVWTGMCVDYADKNSYSSLIEGTWRNQDTVLSAARSAKAYGRVTHGMVLAVPPELSQLGLLDRFYSDFALGKEARWTPPKAHFETVANLPKTITAVIDSGLMDRLTVTNRSGEILCDDKNHVLEVFRANFSRQLSETEQAMIKEKIPFLRQAHKRFTPNEASAKELIEGLAKKVGVKQDKTTVLSQIKTHMKPVDSEPIKNATKNIDRKLR